MVNQSELDRLLQKEWREAFIPNLHTHEWMTVFQELRPSENPSIGICAACVLNEHVESLLESYDWDFQPSNTKPDIFVDHLDKSNAHTIEYDRFGFTKYNLEPLVFVQDYDGLKPRSLEVSQEYRLYHELYFDTVAQVYVKLEQGGNETEAIKLVAKDRIDMRRKELRQFLAAKGMTLVVYFERRYFSETTLEAAALKEQYTTQKDRDFIFRFNMFETMDNTGNKLAFSRLCGKKVINGFPSEKCGIWPYDLADFEHEEFIVGVDENDESILKESGPFDLRNSVVSSKSLPHEIEKSYLTPVFFDLKVLDKYFADPEKYSVTSSHLHCGSRWAMWVSTIHPEYVQVHLGDLGRDLPAAEHKHWRAHNVPPPGAIGNLRSGLTEVHWDRDAVNSALVFQNTYEKFCTDWESHFGWEILKPLRMKEDRVSYYRLRRPLTTDLSALSDSVVTLAILFNESINVSELKKRIIDFDPKDKANRQKERIEILEEYLNQCRFREATDFADYLRDLQSLRSTSVHRKSKRYEKAKMFFGLDKKLPAQVADEIFNKLTYFLKIMYILMTRAPNPPPPDHKG